ncbi:MAG: hypothetical protein ACI9DC_001261 [Gammaproteobacteria bacterium]|jgi:hypothetical protein
MTHRPTVGWVRLFITLAILGSAGLIFFVIKPAAVEEFLVWIEFSSASPGLSGAFILFSMIATFIGGCFVANWVASGFKSAG